MTERREASPAFPWEPGCRWFNGYRPCVYRRSCLGCPSFDSVSCDVLLINLEGLGDVLRTTAVLPAILRAQPGARITWLTRPRAVPLLQGHPLVGRILPFTSDGIVELEGRHFELVLNVDRSPHAASLATRVGAVARRGFGLHPRGGLVPLNPEAHYLFATGLDDDLKFRTNDLSVPELVTRALGFPFVGDPYQLHLAGTERVGPPAAVGFNTGCHPDFPNKRLHLDVLEASIRRVATRLGAPVLLLGGPEDAERNRSLQERLRDLVEWTPTDQGIRVGAAHVDRCEVVFSADSLGLHLAIALQKHVVAWFGVTCPQEIHVYGRGVRLLADVPCAPCWKRTCDRPVRCNERLDPDLICSAVLDCLEARRAGRFLDEVRGATWWRPRPVETVPAPR